MQCKFPPLKPGLGHFDQRISEWILETVETWHELGATPNVLTTLGVITSIAALYSMYVGSFHSVLLFAVLRWYFDYADGILARKYNQVTTFGDYYDHANDLIFIIVIFVLFIVKCKKYWYIPCSIFSLFVFLNLVQTGCIEKECDAMDEKMPENTLSTFKRLCKHPETMKYVDTTVLYVVTLILIAVFTSNEYRLVS